MDTPFNPTLLSPPSSAHPLTNSAPEDIIIRYFPSLSLQLIDDSSQLLFFLSRPGSTSPRPAVLEMIPIPISAVRRASTHAFADFLPLLTEILYGAVTRYVNIGCVMITECSPTFEETRLHSPSTCRDSRGDPTSDGRGDRQR